jgi:SAM-dependent methyltransferase
MTEDTQALLPAFQAALHQIGFDEERIRARLGYQWVIPLADDLENLDTPYASEEDRPTLDRVIKLFVLGEAVSAKPMQTALGEKAWAFVLETGLAHMQDGLLWPNVYLTAWQGFWFAADLAANQAVEDAVFIPDQSAVMMSGMIAPQRDEPKRSMLDIGSGSGILALLANVHFDSVVAVDINPRALAFTRFNAALNNVDITCEVSSFERLSQGDERFDLVTFAMPLLYPYFRRNASAVHTRSANGDTLLTEAYSVLDGVLSERGRAVYWHQILIQPEGHFQSRLAQVKTLQGFDILSNQFNLGSDTWSFSRTLVKRADYPRTGFALRVVPAPADPISHFQTRHDLYRYTGSVSKIAKGDVQDTQIIRRYDHISISHCYDSVDGTWQTEPRATISGTEVSIEVSERVHKIGKGLSVATFLDWFADRQHPQSQGRAALSALVHAGFVYLDAP